MSCQLIRPSSCSPCTACAPLSEGLSRLACCPILRRSRSYNPANPKQHNVVAGKHKEHAGDATTQEVSKDASATLLEQAQDSAEAKTANSSVQTAAESQKLAVGPAASACGANNAAEGDSAASTDQAVSTAPKPAAGPEAMQQLRRRTRSKGVSLRHISSVKKRMRPSAKRHHIELSAESTQDLAQDLSVVDSARSANSDGPLSASNPAESRRPLAASEQSRTPTQGKGSSAQAAAGLRSSNSLDFSSFERILPASAGSFDSGSGIAHLELRSSGRAAARSTSLAQKSPSRDSGWNFTRPSNAVCKAPSARSLGMRHVLTRPPACIVPLQMQMRARQMGIARMHS